MNKLYLLKITLVGILIFSGSFMCLAQEANTALAQSKTQQDVSQDTSVEPDAGVDSDAVSDEVSESAAAQAQTQDPAAENNGAAMKDEDSKIQIKSDGDLTMFYGEKYAIFNTNVVVSDAQGPMLKCQRLSVFFKDQSNIERMIAEKDVVIFHEDVRGNCQRAEYLVSTDIATMTGDPMIKKGLDQYAADKITIFRKKGNILFEPAARLVVFPDDPEPEAEKTADDDTTDGDGADTKDQSGDDQLADASSVPQTTFENAQPVSYPEQSVYVEESKTLSASTTGVQADSDPIKTSPNSESDEKLASVRRIVESDSDSEYY